MDHPNNYAMQSSSQYSDPEPHKKAQDCYFNTYFYFNILYRASFIILYYDQQMHNSTL